MLGKLDFNEIQKKWCKKWDEGKVHEFAPAKGKPAFVIDSPPPFPTGDFHMGNVLNWSYFDFAARYRRMRGYAVLLPQGWDCHGFPTEVKVEKKFGKLPREEFRKKCLEWTHDMIATIKPQMNSLGFSIDWKHEYYTIDDSYKRLVQLSLLKNFEAGLVYRAEHPVLWCPACQSAIAKAESEEIQRETMLNFVKFSLEKDSSPVLIATTRPELIHACVAVAVNPADARYKKIVGLRVRTPLFDKSVPVIADAAVEKDFGSGAVMVCTFGDKQDLIWQKQHSLPVVKAIDEKGLLLNAGEYSGEHLEKARPKIIEALARESLLEKQEALVQTVKIHDRCKKPIELVLSTQWFMRIKGNEEKILAAAKESNWHPSFAYQLFEDWTNGLEWDWCFSRQRVFGIPIPFWHCTVCNKIFLPKEKDLPVDPTLAKPPMEKCDCGGKLEGEKSICDGWVDSSITPLVIAGWPDGKLFNELYPSSLRPQGTDIIRTWGFYTVFRCLMLTGKSPFKEFLINGMVQGEDKKKMSKSLGNYVEAKDVIGKYGADALRQWAALGGSTGKDIAFAPKEVERAKAFLVKLWNASKFVESMDAVKKRPEKLGVADEWLLSRLNATKKTVSQAFENYDYYTAISALYEFFWHEYCDFYLEDIKYRVYDDSNKTREAALYCARVALEETLKMLAPFAPFVCEEIHSHLFAGGKESIHLSRWPEVDERSINPDAERLGAMLHNVIAQIRRLKAEKGISLGADLQLVRVSAGDAVCKRLAYVIDDIKGAGRVKVVEFSPVPNAGNDSILVSIS
ncbi:MAG: valine--tRNA ligase [Candidatus Norongarragalinales archaeon]